MAILKPEPGEYAESYKRYIDLVPLNDLQAALEEQVNPFHSFILGLTESDLKKRYAPEKWSMAEVILHCIDTERIYMFRMLNFARRGLLDIPGFDQDTFAANSHADARSAASLADEFRSVRASTLAFVRSLSEEDPVKQGKANNYQMSVRTLGFVAYGHIAHHHQVMLSRYLS